MTTINQHAFSNCSGLEAIVFGTHLSSIGAEAFSDCTSVTEITVKATEPPLCYSQALEDINKWDCKLFVPVGYKSAYQAADQWKDFLDTEEGTGKADILLGDVDNSNIVDEKDLDMLVSYIMGDTPDGFDMEKADVNEDGEINVADIVEIVKIK